MRVSIKFERDLNRTYEGELTIDEFIRCHNGLLHSLAKHAIRYTTVWYLSDEDDMYQEACYWLTQAMWDFDETRGRSLCDYVLYNVGARLGTIVRVERAAKRHPDPNVSRKIDIWESKTPSQYSVDGEQLTTLEETLPNPGCDPELHLAIKQSFDRAKTELSALARELLIVLIEENGNMAAASRRLIRRKHIRKRFGIDPKHLKYQLNRRVLPEIREHFDMTAIMPVSTGKPSNG